jgi:integrase
VSFYIAEKVAGDEYSRKKTTDRINRMMKTVKEALGEVPPLADWTVDHAYAARDYLLNKGTLKPSSVRRELNVLRGIFSCYKSKKLRSLDNPFEGLELPANAVVDKDARAPLTDELITKIRERLEAHSNRDLQLMWRLLVGTGCRLAEVAGLRVEDVVTSGEFPHLKLVAHEKRRLKNASSAREVPLVADAFDAAKEAVESADHGEALFSRYFGAGGPDRASAALMKHVRALTNDKLLTVHSLRHSFADRCDLAGIGTMEKSAILGHHNASTTEKHYGSKRARLAVLSKAMKAAFEV